MVEVTKPILSVSCLCENGVEAHLAKESGAQTKKIDAYKLTDSQKTREYNLKGAQKTDEYEITGALNPCVKTKKVKNPCVQNSSCVEVRKNDGVEIIHNFQRKRACQDADVKPVVRDPMDDDRVLVQSGAVMTPVPHEPSEFGKQKHNRIVENWWCLEKQFFHIFQGLEKDMEIQHQSWQTSGNPARGWERATSRTNTLSEQMME